MELYPKNLNPDMSETYEWLFHLQSLGRKPDTIRTHKTNVRQCLKALVEDGRSEKAADITVEDIRYLWKTLEVKESVRHAYLRSLSGMVKYHTGVDIEKEAGILYNREACNRIFISNEDFANAFRKADPRQRVMLCLGAYMGLRRVEMSEIRDGDINGSRMVVHGKGHGQEGFVVEMDIPEPVMKAIDDYRKSPMKEGVRDDDYLLQNRGNDKHLHKMHVNKISAQINLLGEETGSYITTHSLRRFYATTLYYQTGLDLQTLRSMMRHADISTTLKCYVDAYDDKKKKASDKLTDYIQKLVS